MHSSGFCRVGSFFQIAEEIHWTCIALSFFMKYLLGPLDLSFCVLFSYRSFNADYLKLNVSGQLDDDQHIAITL